MSKNKRLIIIFSVVCGLTLLIILSSAVFAVSSVRAYCVNVKDDDPMLAELDKQVLACHDIRFGSSIFMLNEKKTIQNLNKKLAASDPPVTNIEVRAIERAFPNRVIIHYIKFEPYFYVAEGGQAYFYAFGGATLMRVLDLADAGAASLMAGAVQIAVEGKISGTAVGSSAFSTSIEHERQSAEAVLAALEKLCSPADLADYFDYIDLSREGYIFAKTNRGVVLEFSSFDNLYEQFRLGVSMYKDFRESGKTEDRVRSGTGTIIVSNTVAGVITAVYTPENRYG
ncbi:MAG: hypothetical protein FWD58_00505 [Firmicutes bacterium]|nr:hypothetical protein [Bacillota bacterium]